MSKLGFGAWFAANSRCPPHEWQARLGEDARCGNRLIRVPTGMGKTLGAVSAWAYHRLTCKDDSWPRRLIWCLPMRTLVEQTAGVIKDFIRDWGQDDAVSVNVLMGGADTDDWYLHPEREAVLVGTQDMLLSRALNRGYAAPRARWPMEFGLLNQDCLWVMDEVQLMDVGLATSAQVQAMRRQDALDGKTMRPCFTWWMSATLQPNWLESVDTQDMVGEVGTPLAVDPAALASGIGANKKTVVVRPVDSNKAVAKLVAQQHAAGTLTLVVLNRVKDATEVANGLRDCPADVRLVHSRFRPLERRTWRDQFLRKDAAIPAAGRIIVATQVVEAGVDISARLLVTDLAPWPSLVQRFGRCARFAGESGDIVVVDRGLAEGDEAAARPYSAAEIVVARKHLESLDDAGVSALESFEGRLSSEARRRLYPYEPMHLLLRREMEELFDTMPDLTGADLDISRFIRSGEERDVLVFWRELDKRVPPDDIRAGREELCPVAVYDAREWMFDKGSASTAGKWVWDYLAGSWRRCRREDVYPGQAILVDKSTGGYSKTVGWTGKAGDVPDVLIPSGNPPGPEQTTDAAQDREDLSRSIWKTILTHGRETMLEAQALAAAFNLPPSVAQALSLAALWHDVGKAHPAFQGSIESAAPGRPDRCDIAKAPSAAWKSAANLYSMPAEGERRPGFRHELATAMALIAVLERCHPSHEALLGQFVELFTALGRSIPESAPREGATPAEGEILALDGGTLNLLLYLACAHHGKLRGSLQAAPQDQDYRDRDERGMPIRGVREGDRLPPLVFADSDDRRCTLPETELHLDLASIGVSARTGASWAERVRGLLDRHGPFTLGWMEALLRAADIRASRKDTADPELGIERNRGAA